MRSISSAAAARMAGFDNLSLDLIYGLPGQTMEDWQRTLADAVALGLISGASNGGQTYLEPQGSATREQVATILMEFCKNVKK